MHMKKKTTISNKRFYSSVLPFMDLNPIKYEHIPFCNMPFIYYKTTLSINNFLRFDLHSLFDVKLNNKYIMYNKFITVIDGST